MPIHPVPSYVFSPLRAYITNLEENIREAE